MLLRLLWVGSLLISPAQLAAVQHLRDGYCAAPEAELMRSLQYLYQVKGGMDLHTRK